MHDKPLRYPTTVTLVEDPSGDIKMMFCINCQAPFTQYNGHIISIAPGLPPVRPYTVTRCKNKNCPMQYVLLGIVKMSDKYSLGEMI